MNSRTTLALGRSALRSAQYVIGGQVHFSQKHIGDVLKTPDGDTFIVYRQTMLRPTVEEMAPDSVVLVFRMQVTDRETGGVVRAILLNPLANVAAPFFIGMPGFKQKLWLAGERPGEFLELYRWASKKDADRFVDVLQSLLDPFDLAEAASFEVVEERSIAEYIDSHSVAWRDATRCVTGHRRRLSSLAMVVLVVVAAIVGYVAGSRRRGDHSEHEIPDE